MAATAAMAALILGAMTGAVVWRLKSSLFLGGLLSLAIFVLAATVFLGFRSLTVAVIYGIPALIMTFLISHLAANAWNVRLNMRALWATLAGIGTALVAALLYLLMLRFSALAAVWVALGADACLIPLAMRNRKVVSQ